VSVGEKLEFVTLAAQDPKMLASALSVAIKRVHGMVPEWYAANRLSRDIDMRVPPTRSEGSGGG
jgi:hypothetical protein